MFHVSLQQTHSRKITPLTQLRITLLFQNLLISSFVNNLAQVFQLNWNALFENTYNIRATYMHSYYAV